MKFLHSADLHLDSPFASQPSEQAEQLKRAQLQIPGRLAELCRQEACSMLLLSGDIFDGPYTLRTLDALRGALEEIRVPVFISPGNHDFCSGDSPWQRELWPKNVHIFKRSSIDSVSIPELDCCVYGAGFSSMDCPGLLSGFQASCPERYAIAVLHGDPTQIDSPYCPVTAAQVKESQLDYLALGHIHKSGAYRAGRTLCAWPGCPMGRGFDETGVKGALVVTLEDTAQTRFVPLDTPRFFDYTLSAGNDPAAALATVLPPTQSQNFYRVTLVGESAPFQIPQLLSHFPALHNLQILDKTVPPVDPWSRTGEDSLEGMLFRILQDSLAGQDIAMQQKITLAAKISRQILDGQEVDLS